MENVFTTRVAARSARRRPGALRRPVLWLGMALLTLLLTACPSTSATVGTRTVTGQFVGGDTVLSMQQAAATAQAVTRETAFQAALSAQGYQPTAGLWAPVVTTELWSEGDRVIASPADGGEGVTATVSTAGSFSLTLRLNVTYSLQLVRDGAFIAYLSNADGSPINIVVTASGASIDLGTISVVGGKFVVGIDPTTYAGVEDEGLPGDYEQVMAEVQTISTELMPSGIPAEELYDRAVFLALDSDDRMIGLGAAPDGALSISVASDELADAVTNFATFDMALLGDIQDFPANTATFPIQMPYLMDDRDFSTGLPATIDDGTWGLFTAEVTDETGEPIEDALIAAVSVAVGPDGVEPTVAVVNVGRSDADGNVRFYLLTSLTSDPAAYDSYEYTYSLIASYDLSAEFVDLYWDDGSPALLTPVPGESMDNHVPIVLEEPDPVVGEWNMYANNVGPYGVLDLNEDGTYTWTDTTTDTGTWGASGAYIFLDDAGSGIIWRLEYKVDELGPYFEVYTLIGSTWTEWGYAEQ